MLIQGVVFDFDNTIATLNLSALLRNPYKSKHLKEMKDICDQHRGFRMNDIQETISSRTDQNFITKHDHYAREVYTHKHINRAVYELITHCDAHSIPRAVLSDHPCIKKLRAVGLDAGWSAVVHCRTYNALKPLPDALFAIAAQMGVAPSTLLMVGDRWDTDGLAAFHVGAQFVHLSMTSDALQWIHHSK